MTKVDDVVFMIGGGSTDPGEDAFVHNADVWQMNAREEQWVKVECGGVPFTARRGHSAVVYERRYIIVFGGASINDDAEEGPDLGIGYGFIHTTVPRNDTMVLDISTMEWSAPVDAHNTNQRPHPRRGHCATIQGDRMIVVGGDIQTGHNMEVELLSLALIWMLDLKTWTWTSVTGLGNVPYGLSLCCHERIGPTDWAFFGGSVICM